MNYQHAFHAGNFADVHKHAVLARVLIHLRNKPAAFRVIDTHAGAARYDLLAQEATRGGEWHDGIAKVWAARPTSGDDRSGGGAALLTPYLDAVASLNPGGSLRTYPGSPLVALALLRPQDRLIACELEPRAAALLQTALRRDRRAKALTIDGWTALGAYVPPKERRGVVLIDPPFEEAADFTRLSSALVAAHRKWPTGIYMLWYPIKERDAAEALVRRLKRTGLAGLLRCEINLAPPAAALGLTGSGVILVNPPYKLDADLGLLLPALGKILSPQATIRTDWLVPAR
ncbi:MAG TPA: 23S rRNA (adenine(2030)-N(6))-methyltransferase RlmJ [Xanthobacteraceae bacterium]|nr:23S rRNA (adenine(2030)-N(6))-methyltransferase RlmJ [Xanthobacteraceae bacterium]